MVKIRADFSEAAEGGNFNTRNVPEGDYIGKISACELGVSKNGNKQLIFTIALSEVRGATYPYYCSLDGKGAWKLRGLLEAIGKKVPKSAANIDTDNLVGKAIGMELVDDEYEGRLKSVVNAVFPPSQVNATADAVDDEEDEEEEDEPTPPKKRVARKPAPEPEPEDEDEDEEEEEEEPAPRRRPAAKKAPAKKATPARRKPAPVEDDDEDLDELDIEEL